MSNPQFSDVTWDWDDPNQPCEICLGRGWVYLEDSAGAPRRQVECSYCHGTGNSLWVGEKRATRTHNYNANRLIGRGALFFAMGSLWWSGKYWPAYNADSTGSAWLLLAHWGLWILIALGWLAYLCFPHRGEKASRKRRHAPGFTTDREKVMLGGLAAGTALKGKWDHRHGA